MDPVLAYVWLSCCSNLNRRTKKFLVELFNGAESIYGSSDSELEGCLEVYCEDARQRKRWGFHLDRNLEDARNCMTRASAMGAWLMHYDSPEYPALLREIADPPMVLYGLGDPSLLLRRGIAVVGTRRASSYGRWAAFQIAARIAECGTPVISGMAEGIDAEAHAGCLSKGTGTIAVLGTGIEHCFPASNRKLYRQIRQEGLILSEFKPEERGYASYFPLRNRVISGLSSAVVVVEGAEKSGSMITAGLAAEQGRDVFAVPGNINQPNSAGVNRLIYDGAYPITDLDTAAAALGLSSQRDQRLRESLSAEEMRVMDIVKREGMISRESLCTQAGIAAASVASLVTILELKGLLQTSGTKIVVAK
ncbi:MAG TPA: DNA-protecting protein DprA [Clostridiales bacterium]|nr:DNA-protecting protein DprA [Clostridiales bacterium]